MTRCNFFICFCCKVINYQTLTSEINKNPNYWICTSINIATNEYVHLFAKNATFLYKYHIISNGNSKCLYLHAHRVHTLIWSHVIMGLLCTFWTVFPITIAVSGTELFTVYEFMIKEINRDPLGTHVFFLKITLLTFG